MNDLRLWYVAVRYRWKAIAVVFTITLAAAFVFGITRTPSYSAEARILFDDSNLGGGEGRDGDRRANAAAATRSQVIHSRLVAQRVAKNLSPGGQAQLQDLWQREVDGLVSFERWSIAWLLQSTSVDAPTQGNVAAIQASAPTPELSAEVANGFARSFIDVNQNIQTEPTRSYTAWLEQQTQQARSELDQAQQALAGFKRENQLIGGNDLSPEIDRLQALSTELAAAEAEAAGASARSRASGPASVAVQQTDVIQALRGEIATQAAEVAQLGARYGDEHTARRQAESKLADLRASLARETAVATQSLDVSNTAAANKRRGMETLVQQQRNRMLRMTGSIDRLELLQADSNRARRNYEQLSQSLSQNGLLAERPRADVRMLDPAFPPIERSSPNMPLVLALGALLGLLGGVVAAIILEHLYPRARTRDHADLLTRSEDGDVSLDRPQPI